MPLAAVALAAAGDDHRRGPIGQQPLQVHFAVDVVQPQLDQLGALLDQVAMLGDHVAVTAAGDADANHGIDETPETWNERIGQINGREPLIDRSQRIDFAIIAAIGALDAVRGAFRSA